MRSATAIGRLTILPRRPERFALVDPDGAVKNWFGAGQSQEMVAQTLTAAGYAVDADGNVTRAGGEHVSERQDDAARYRWLKANASRLLALPANSILWLDDFIDAEIGAARETSDGGSGHRV